MSKEKLKKYYAHEDGKSQLRCIKAKNDEEALLKFRELFGHNNFVAGFLNHAEPKIPWKTQHKIMSDIMGEDFANFADTMHSVGAL